MLLPANDFINAIGKKNGKKNLVYRAYVDIGNDQVGITPVYPKETLELFIREEILPRGYKVLRIESVDERGF